MDRMPAILKRNCIGLTIPVVSLASVLVVFLHVSYAGDEEGQLRALSIALQPDSTATDESSLASEAALETSTVLQSTFLAKRALATATDGTASVPTREQYSDYYDNAPTTERLQRFNDQHINALARTTVRSGQTAEDNHHSEFSSRSQNTKAWNRHLDEIYRLKSDLYTSSIALQSTLETRATKINSLYDSLKAAKANLKAELSKEDKSEFDIKVAEDNVKVLQSQ